MRVTDKMPISTTSMVRHLETYKGNLGRALGMAAMLELPKLGAALRDAWRLGHTVYLCGNGGSAGNAIHLANDLLYGAGLRNGGGLRVEALSANPAVLTCLANDVGYDQIFAEQLKVKANAGDVLIVLSGSGNSENVVRALEVGNTKGMLTFAILGFSGGRCKNIAQHSIHFAIDDMQVAEDLQLIVGHICMQWLRENPVSGLADKQNANIPNV
jgi:D-sedoheptulose 7-phosphate isomerase